jgi:glutamate synthase (NADPH/NADH) small chain
MARKRSKIAPRTAMPEQPAAERARNFTEVGLGYTPELAAAEAKRCLQCKKPKCVNGCPVEIDIKAFIGQLAEGDVDAAYAIIRRTNSLPAVCGRVCPQEVQCEGACVLAKTGDPIAIGRLERYVADTFAAKSGCEEVTGEPACPAPGELRAACIGSGPSSLTVAGYLASRGVQVTVYEALHEPGGVLSYGIPEFRLPKSVVAREVGALGDLGVDIRCNWVGGRTIEVQELLDEGYQAVFLGVGAGLPKFLGLPGENLVGVYSANEYLTRANLGRAYQFPEQDTPIAQGKRVCVIGGGNVAMDSARTALRLGAESVSVVYRRTQGEMPARKEEIHHALDEGVRLEILSSPLEYVESEEHEGVLAGLRCQRMELGEPDASGRSRPVAIEGEVTTIDCDLAIVCVGTGPNRVLLESTPELDLNKRGYVAINEETGETSIPNVFAGGDIVTGSATVILAMGAGRRAAREMARRLLGVEDPEPLAPLHPAILGRRARAERKQE